MEEVAVLRRASLTVHGAARLPVNSSRFLTDSNVPEGLSGHTDAADLNSGRVLEQDSALNAARPPRVMPGCHK
jgi:hypothetical protein